MTNDPHLLALLATHGAQIRALLPAYLDPASPWEVKQYGNLTKYVLGEARPGVWAMLHNLRGPDAGPNGPHDHPTRMDSFGIKGCYWERSYHAGERVELTLRAAGGNYTVWPDTVHEIVDLPEGEAWTLCFTYEVVREWRHYPELADAPHSKYHTLGRPDVGFRG